MLGRGALLGNMFEEEVVYGFISGMMVFLFVVDSWLILVVDELFRDVLFFERNRVGR